MKRRDFLKSTALSSAALSTGFVAERPFSGQIKTIFMATSWGYNWSLDAFCAKAKEAGYEGIELWWSNDKIFYRELFDALQKHELQVGFLTSGNGPDFDKHFAEFKANLTAVLQQHPVKPLYINCHSGKDYFTAEQNGQLISFATEMSQKAGIEVLHETHRGRMCYSAPITRRFLEQHPDMALTLDISHWTNVHESLLDDQPEAVALALSRARHIHLRVGHQEGPQVNDPRAPEWQNTLNHHLKWWDTVVQHRIEAGAEHLTFLTEFGPPNYMPTLPYTKQPVADQWEINVYMMNLIRARYA